MANLFTKLIPLTLGAAVSPIALAATILILANKVGPLRKSIAFALGELLTLAAIGGGVLLAFHHAGLSTARPGDAHGTAKDLVDVAFGLVLLLLALHKIARIFASRRGVTADGVPADDQQDSASDDDEASLPKSGESAIKFFAAGIVAMLLNLSTIVIFIAAMKVIAEANVDGIDGTMAFIFVTITALALTVVPIVFYAIAPKPAARVLEPIGNWTKTHSNQVGAVLLTGFGIYLLVKGLRGA